MCKLLVPLWHGSKCAQFSIIRHFIVNNWITFGRINTQRGAPVVPWGTLRTKRNGCRAFSAWGNIQADSLLSNPFSCCNISYTEKACENYVIITFFAEHLVGDKGCVLWAPLWAQRGACSCLTSRSHCCSWINTVHVFYKWLRPLNASFSQTCSRLKVCLTTASHYYFFSTNCLE